MLIPGRSAAAAPSTPAGTARRVAVATSGRLGADTRSTRLATMTAVAAVLIAAGVFTADATGADTVALVGAAQLAAAAAVAAAARIHRPSLALPWWLVAAGFAVGGLRRLGLALTTPGAAGDGDWVLAALHPVSLVLYFAAAGAVAVVCARRRSRDHLLDAAALGLAVILLAAEATRLLIPAPTAVPATLLPPGAVVVLGALLLAATLHLWRVVPAPKRVVALLTAAIAARLLRDVLLVAGAAHDGLVAALAVALSPLAFGLAAAALGHPAAARAVAMVTDGTAPANTRQVAAFAGAVLVLPLLWLALALRHPSDQLWLVTVALGMLTLTALVLVRLIGLVRSVTDTTALRHSEARRDRATGLPNAHALLEELERQIGSTAARPALLMVGLAGVGEAESVHGVDGSVGLLRTLADRLAFTVPAGSTIAVLSGRDLAVVTGGQDDDELDELAWRLHTLSTHPITVGDAVVSCSAGVGIAVHEPGETPEALLRRADLASRWAERPGSSRVQRYRLPMSTHVAYEVSIRAGIREAISCNRLRLWCQPQVDLVTGGLVGVECLARWHDPRHGHVSPTVFVAAAREAGVAAELDAQMVHAAARQAAQWRAAGLFVPRVAVNVEPTTVAHPAFIDVVASALRRAALPPGALEIELTEAVTAHDHAAAREMLWRLRALGVRLAIDDFGTGYSSLANLHHMPLDVLKVDRELVGALDDEPALATAAIALGEHLGLQVVAEGVETTSQRSALEQLGCRTAQGYLFARPMPVDELAAWVAQHPPSPTRAQPYLSA